MAEAKYKRRCENWLSTFGEWVLPLSESPETFIFWTGLFTIACALRRKVKIPQSYLGRWECPPHLYVMFVGPPGGPRKTTAANTATELLDGVGSLVRASNVASQAAILKELVDTEDASIYIISEEFSDLIMKSGNEMYEMLTSLFDGKKSLKATTISRGVELVERPCINMLAATTPVWISNNMTEEIIGGGFSSRVIFVYEETVRRRKMFYDDVFDAKLYGQQKTALIDDLKHIATLSGDFSFEKSARDFMEDWYINLKPEKNPKLQGYAMRKPAHVMKVAMLWHTSYSDELVLHKTDIEMAMELLGGIEKKLPRVFEGIGKNPYVFSNREIYSFLREAGRTSRVDLLRQFESVDTPSKMDEVLSGLLEMKMIKTVNENNTLYYEAIEYGKK